MMASTKAIKLAAVIIPAAPLLAAADLEDRLHRGNALHVVARHEDVGKFTQIVGDYTRIAVGGVTEGWSNFEDAYDLSLIHI